MKNAGINEKIQPALFSPAPQGPEFAQISNHQELLDKSLVLRKLRKIDWAFEKDKTGYLSHAAHPYPAKFIPQIPGSLICQLSLPGELVLDPFGGSGTTALEAIRLGRRAISIDINPLATLIARTKARILYREDLDNLSVLAAALQRSKPRSLEQAFQFTIEHGEFIPVIPNIEKWFSPVSTGELAFIRSRIAQITTEGARDIAQVALSRIILKASNQDSETRYAAREKTVLPGSVIDAYLSSLDFVERSVSQSSIRSQNNGRFLSADIRNPESCDIYDDSVDLVVTSPPYGNAMDYHLYHRFRLFWLGEDPVQMGRSEIGSHLRHQKEKTGFADYLNEMEHSLSFVHRVLRPGRFSAWVVGDAIYYGKKYDTATHLAKVAKKLGFEVVGRIKRPLHKTKRSFNVAGRRAVDESILILSKKHRMLTLKLGKPNYRLWDYENRMARQESKALLPGSRTENTLKVSSEDATTLNNARKLTFVHDIDYGSHSEPTWQKILEQGFNKNGTKRKESKYATHGLHSYKGKFYPQLAKSLLNSAALPTGSRILDPFCGSGTTILEGYLNGMEAYGLDLHPLAVKIGTAKIGILETDFEFVRLAADHLLDRLKRDTRTPRLNQPLLEGFPEDTLKEIKAWFPNPVIQKIETLLAGIRSVSTGNIRNFFEVILSDCLRQVSQQEPADLRIRRRKEEIKDAELYSLFENKLNNQMRRLEQFWLNRSFAPIHFRNATINQGDSRDWNVYETSGIKRSSIDLILTSPPYATALPYIDTDRLSLLVLFGMNSSVRRPLEESLTGSREIKRSEKDKLEALMSNDKGELPSNVVRFLKELCHANEKGNAGFRKKNLPSLLYRYFRDMRRVISSSCNALRPGGESFWVLGDSYTMINDERKVIPTTKFVQAVAEVSGMEFVQRTSISVTTDNHKHIRNAITSNVILRMRKP